MGGEAGAKAEAPASWSAITGRRARAEKPGPVRSVAPADAIRWPVDRHGRRARRRARPWLRHSRDRQSGESRQSDLAPFGSRRCVWAVTVRASHLSRAIARQVRGAYELQWATGPMTSTYHRRHPAGIGTRCSLFFHDRCPRLSSLVWLSHPGDAVSLQSAWRWNFASAGAQSLWVLCRLSCELSH
jgi:hypothetical protein